MSCCASRRSVAALSVSRWLLRYASDRCVSSIAVFAVSTHSASTSRHEPSASCCSAVSLSSLAKPPAACSQACSTTVLCSRLRRRSAAQALNRVSIRRSVSHRSARRGPSVMRCSAWSMPSMLENQPRGSKILPRSSVTMRSCVSPACMLRVSVAESSAADDHSSPNAALACARSGQSTVFASAAFAPCGPAALAIWPATSENMLCWAAAKSLPARPHISANACMYSTGVTSEYHHLEHYDLAHRLALVQPIEADVDLVEFQPAAHEPVDRKLSAAIERDVPR